MTAPMRFILASAGLVLFAGCNPHEDVAARYALERKLWTAQRFERQVNIQFVRASRRDLNLAVQAFTEVVASDPLASPPAASWKPEVVDDIREILIVSKIALADLYFLAERYNEAGSVYSRALGDPDLGFAVTLDLRLGVLTASYLAGEENVVESQSAAIFLEIVENESFWNGEYDLRKVFLNIPLVLVQIYRDRGDTERLREYAELAGNFYARVQDTWPESDVALEAGYAQVRLLMLDEDFRGALEIIDSMRPWASAENSAELSLIKGEILGFALGEIGAGREELAVALRSTDAYVRQAANLDMALLHLKAGQEAEGLSLLREIEGDKSTDIEIASRAMFARAMYLEKVGRWDEALPLLRRFERMFPDTTPALEAPLAITRHFLDRGEVDLALRSLKHASEYYVSLINRGSRFRGDRILVEDFLIEGYLLLDKPEEAAQVLLDDANAWDDASTAGAMLKSASLYARVLDDRDRAAQILENCIELFPDSRYAKIAQQRLDDLRNDS